VGVCDETTVMGSILIGLDLKLIIMYNYGRSYIRKRKGYVMKKLLSSFLALSLVVVMIPAAGVSAATDGYYTYTVTDGQATITDVKTSISGDIVIPTILGEYPVTMIGESAFRDCTNLESIYSKWCDEYW